MWKDILLRLYQQGKIDESRLENAVFKRLITEEEKQEILQTPIQQ